MKHCRICLISDWIFNNAHVQPTGAYHYHGTPESVVDNQSETDDLVLVGYAADGHPMYVSQSNAYASSYRLKSGTRPSGPGGSYDGTFTQDFEYVDGLGDLDDCNGIHLDATAEYPDGTYAYLITDAFPYISRCLHGEPDESFNKGGGAPPAGNGPPNGGPPPPR